MIKRFIKTLPFIVFIISIFSFGVVYGAYAFKLQLPPIPQLRYGYDSFVLLVDEFNTKWYLSLPSAETETQIIDQSRLAPGLVMLVGVTTGRRNFVRVIRRDGSVVQEWQPDWFDIWGNSGNIPDGRRPKTHPGAILHGVELAANGDVIFNFERLSTIRLSPCGDVVWKLDNLGHHSIHIDDNGDIWASAENYVAVGDTGQQNHEAPLRSETMQQISPNGEIIKTLEILDVLRKNDLLGLIHMSTLDNGETKVSGDTLHLNDIEIFPDSFSSSIFKPGDILVSLRNINTIFVMDPDTEEIKFRATGEFLRQHDPDFAGGNRILVFDNRNLSPSKGPEKLHSRILEIDAGTGKVSVYFKGNGESQFYTHTMGAQQLLPNGNLLITSSQQGRAFEVTSDGKLIWNYNNKVDANKNGLLTQATLLSQRFDAEFFEKILTNCK